MTTELTLEALLDALTESPEDADLRRVYADALEDAGEIDAAAVQRRLAAVAPTKRLADGERAEAVYAYLSWLDDDRLGPDDVKVLQRFDGDLCLWSHQVYAPEMAVDSDEEYVSCTGGAGLTMAEVRRWDSRPGTYSSNRDLRDQP